MAEAVSQKRQFELIGVILAFSAFYVLVVGPFLGAAFGFEQAAIQGDGYRLGLDDVLSPRGILLILSTLLVTLGYMYLRPRLSGTTPKRYWGGE